MVRGDNQKVLQVLARHGGIIFYWCGGGALGLQGKHCWCCVFYALINVP